MLLQGFSGHGVSPLPIEAVSNHSAIHVQYMSAEEWGNLRGFCG